MGLLSEAPHGPGAELFRSAVEGLGAHCTHIQPSHLALATPLEIQRTARILGRLYDALECQGMASTLVQKLRVDSGVPVYDGVACPAHATAPLAGLLDTDVHASINRCLVLQAVLLCTLV